MVAPVAASVAGADCAVAAVAAGAESGVAGPQRRSLAQKDLKVCRSPIPSAMHQPKPMAIASRQVLTQYRLPVRKENAIRKIGVARDAGRAVRARRP